MERGRLLGWRLNISGLTVALQIDTVMPALRTGQEDELKASRSNKSETLSQNSFKFLLNSPMCWWKTLEAGAGLITPQDCWTAGL